MELDRLRGEEEDDEPMERDDDGWSMFCRHPHSVLLAEIKLLLQALLEQSQKPVGPLGGLSPEERHKLLAASRGVLTEKGVGAVGSPRHEVVIVLASSPEALRKELAGLPPALSRREG